MASAVAAFKHQESKPNKEKLSMRAIANLFNLPFETFRHQLNGKISTVKPAYGAKPLLSAMEEQDLVTVIKGFSHIGTPISTPNLVRMVNKYSQVNNKPVAKYGRGWWAGFKKRNPNVVLKSARNLSLARAGAGNIETLSKFFDKLEETLVTYNLTNKPHLIFNYDETRLTTVPSHFTKTLVLKVSNLLIL